MSGEIRSPNEYQDGGGFFDNAFLSNRDGFFMDYLHQIDCQIPEAFVDSFSQCKTDEERFVMMWNFEPTHQMNVEISYKNKDKEMSERLRIEGNEKFKENKDDEALSLYSQAIIFSPHHEGQCLSLSYANRSAVLYHQGDYKSSLEDIQLALEAGYPQRLHSKVYNRKGLCLMQLGQYNEARKAFEKGLESVFTAEMDEKKLQYWDKYFNDKLIFCEGKPDEVWEPNGPNTSVQLYGSANAALPSASSAVLIQQSELQGRFAVAGSSIPVGEILIAEKPYVAVLKADRYVLHCHVCFSRNLRAVPCLWCSSVAFCSVGCRDLALATHHKWECKFLSLLQDSGMSLNCFLALRIISQHGVTFFKKIRPLLQENPKPPSPASPHRSSDYLSVYNLVRLEEIRTQKNFILLTTMATFLLKVLRRAGFFGNCDRTSRSHGVLTDDEAFIGSLLLRNLQVTQFNAHEVSGINFKTEDSRLEESKSIFLGLGIYPTAAFCNHACYPSVTRYFVGTKLVLISIRPLQSGDILAENYGPMFTKTTREVRHAKLLSLYWFKCTCEPCIGNWPVYDEMTQTKRFSCQKCGDALRPKSPKISQVICDTCGTKQNVINLLNALNDAYEYYEEGKNHVLGGRYNEAVKAIATFIKKAYKLVVLPNYELFVAFDTLRNIFAAKSTIRTFGETKSQGKMNKVQHIQNEKGKF